MFRVGVVIGTLLGKPGLNVSSRRRLLENSPKIFKVRFKVAQFIDKFLV